MSSQESESDVYKVALSLDCVTDANMLFGDYDLIVKIEASSMGKLLGMSWNQSEQYQAWPIQRLSLVQNCNSREYKKPLNEAQYLFFYPITSLSH